MKGWRDGWLEYLDTIGGGYVVILLLDFAAVYLEFPCYLDGVSILNYSRDELLYYYDNGCNYNLVAMS